MSAKYICRKCGRAFEKHEALGGHIGWCGKDTSEHRRKMSEANLGNHHSAETRRKMSEARRGKNNSSYGRHHSPEARQKMSEAGRGRRHSPETRQKMSEAHRNPSAERRRKMSEAMLGKNNPNYGKHLSAEHRRKLSEAKRGAKHWRWKGGSFPYGPLWPIQRRRARNRDNYTCQRCGITEEELTCELSVHHIRPFCESHDNTLPNLICLCENYGGNGCHKHCEYHPEDCPEPRRHWLLK